jgi:alpha-L-fucosidase
MKNGPSSSRRRFLTRSAAVAGALAAERVLQPSLAAAQNADPTTAPGSIPDLKIDRPLAPAPTPIPALASFAVTAGPVAPTLESMTQHFAVPDWYRDAKFGIWAHWGPQAQPGMGDWYAQRMYAANPGASDFYGPYREGSVYERHVKRYGHPSKFGYKDVVNTWKAEKWNPTQLLDFYKKSGAKFFCAMANHHDNFDAWDSTYQPWNSVRVGPKKNIMAGWERATRAVGLPFAISSHSASAWTYFQTAQAADRDGPLAGVAYDGRHTKTDGKGKWWDGLDPQDLYAQHHPIGRPSADNADYRTYAEKFLNRTIDLINKHNPDLLYFDGSFVPLAGTSDAGLKIAAYHYNRSITKHGKLQAVLTGKSLRPEHLRALVNDIERGAASSIAPMPWQTDTCIGQWHYDQRLADEHRYKSAKDIVQMLVDIVSKNGNLMLSVPLKGDGSLDSQEIDIVDGIGRWLTINGEGIYGTRPWKVYGEGPSVVDPGEATRAGGAALADVRGYSGRDVRFTAKGETIFAFILGFPTNGKITLKSLAAGSPLYPREVGRVEFMGMTTPMQFTRDGEGLHVIIPGFSRQEITYGLKIIPGI